MFRDLGMRGVDILTVGQYLRPSKDHLPIARFYEPAEFEYLRSKPSVLDFATLSQVRWFDPVIMHMSTPTPLPLSGIVARAG